MHITSLHITNGDSAANLIKASSINGDVLTWRDPMHHGPFPANLNLDELGDIRAEYLAGKDLDVNVTKREFRSRNLQLGSAMQYAEITLWFEHDLLDQLQMLELLHWFSERSEESSRLKLICINRFPGIAQFRGLGQLNCDQIESLWPSRVAVTDAQLTLAKSAWESFRNSDPKGLEQIVQTDLKDLPFLKTALRRHLQEYPWLIDGLTRTERQILTLVSTGVTNPTSLFLNNMALEDALYIGDWHTYRVIASLNRAGQRLLNCAPEDTFLFPPSNEIPMEQFTEQKLSLSSVGLDVLAGDQTARSIIRRNEWLGGVHLQSAEKMWMWNDASSQLVLV